MCKFYINIFHIRCYSELMVSKGVYVIVKKNSGDFTVQNLHEQSRFHQEYHVSYGIHLV